MKTIPARRLVCLGFATLATLLPLLRAAEVKPETPKTHVLFMGADLEVQREKKYYRVEDVMGSELKVHIGKREVFVPTRGRQTDLKVDHGLKLSTTSVKLDHLESGPAYTPANDPVRKMIAASGAAGGMAAVQDLAYGRMIQAEIMASSATNTLSRTPENSASRGQVEAAYNAAMAEYSASARQAEMGNELMLSDQANTGGYVERMNKEKDEGNFDAMDVSFKVSSPVELDDPYVVILFKFQPREAKPGDEGILIHAKSIPPIGPKPQYFRAYESGLPIGFKYLNCTVHIYNRGEEVATNLSPNRVELTREEAQQYMVMEYIGAHKGATVPAMAVASSLPIPRRKQLTLDQLNRTYYARVAKDG
ncbi:MAG: hypothetical protein ABUL61_05305, partial [Oleiharenicola lentus]